MLKRIFRLPLKNRTSFTQTVSSQFVVLKIAHNNLSYNRCGFIISKKTAPLSINRNRTKRKIRNCIETVFKQLPVGYDFLFITKKDLSKDCQNDLCQNMNKLLQKGGLL
jgi:ribonuclease P protein component